MPILKKKIVVVSSVNTATQSAEKILSMFNPLMLGTHILGTHLPLTVCCTKCSPAALNRMAHLVSWYSFYIYDKIQMINVRALKAYFNLLLKKTVSEWQIFVSN